HPGVRVRKPCGCRCDAAIQPCLPVVVLCECVERPCEPILSSFISVMILQREKIANQAGKGKLTLDGPITSQAEPSAAWRSATVDWPCVLAMMHESDQRRWQ